MRSRGPQFGRRSMLSQVPIERKSLEPDPRIMKNVAKPAATTAIPVQNHHFVYTAPSWSCVAGAAIVGGPPAGGSTAAGGGDVTAGVVGSVRGGSATGGGGTGSVDV